MFSDLNATPIHRPLLVDMDGTLIRYTPRSDTPELLPGVVTQLRECILEKKYDGVVIITNQRSSNERGLSRATELVAHLRKITYVDLYMLDSEYYRKPSPMIMAKIWDRIPADSKLLVTAENPLEYVGDMASDQGFVYNVGVMFPHIHMKFAHRNTVFPEVFTQSFTFVTNTLYDVMRYSTPPSDPVVAAISAFIEYASDPVPTTFILIGLPGSGKSTLSTHIHYKCKKHGYVYRRYNGDSGRATGANRQLPYSALPKELRRIINTDASSVEKTKKPLKLVVDYVNGNAETRAQLTEILEPYYRVVMINMRVNANFNQLLLNYRTLSQPELPEVPEIAIRKMRSSFTYATQLPETSPSVQNQPSKTKSAPGAVILDIDVSYFYQLCMRKKYNGMENITRATDPLLFVTV